MKKNGILCIAIVVALLVGGVSAVSAAEQAATITQRVYETQDIANFNEIMVGGDVTMDDVSGNNICQVVLSRNMQCMQKSQLAGIIQVGDSDNNWIDIWL